MYRLPYSRVLSRDSEESPPVIKVSPPVSGILEDCGSLITNLHLYTCRCKLPVPLLLLGVLSLFRAPFSPSSGSSSTHCRRLLVRLKSFLPHQLSYPGDLLSLGPEMVPRVDSSWGEGKGVLYGSCRDDVGNGHTEKWAGRGG